MGERSSREKVSAMGDAAVEDMLDFPKGTARGIGRYATAAAAYPVAAAADAGKYLKDKVMGTKEQNEEARDRMRKMDERDPDTAQAKVNRAIGYKKGGSVSSASKRADGIAIRGKTRA